MTDGSEACFSFGAWVRRRRKALDLTQAALAERVGCAPVTISKLEVEVFRPSRVMAERLAACLEIPPDEWAMFLHVARAGRTSDCLPPPLLPSTRLLAPTPPQATQMPMDTIPPLAPLPPGSRMPLRRNPLFVGRLEQLCQVARRLNVGKAAEDGQPEIVAVTGLGGIGKTQLACEFVHRYGQFFVGGVFWLSCADPATIPVEVAACGGGAGMHLSPDFAMLSLDEQVEQVLSAWKHPTPRLLVFDNCEEEALLDAWQPTHGGCQVLITSRRHHWNPALGVQTLPLDVLPRHDSLALLHMFRPDVMPDDPDLNRIADVLGDLPLALHLAGSFLAHYHAVQTPAQYLQRLQVPTMLDDRSLQHAKLSPTKHVQHVARTFEQSYERLDPTDTTDDLARMLLARAACFAPGEPLPRWLLLQTLDLPEDDTDRALVAEDALTRLIDLGLLDPDGDALRLHRLLVAFVRTVAVEAMAQQAVETTILRVVDAVNQTDDFRAVLAVQPHLRFIAHAAQPRADERTAALYSALGTHVHWLGTYGEAQAYHERAVAIRERVLEQDHPDTARSLHSLGASLWEQGEYAGARSYYERALAMQEQVLGRNHPDTACSLHSLGIVLWEFAQYADAEDCIEQAAAIQAQALGAEHPTTARSLNTLGVVLESQGQYAEAQRCLERALQIQERVLGREHPRTTWSMHNVGVVLWKQGKYAEAQQCLEQTVTIQERVLGSEHPATARSLNSLGLVVHARGALAAAKRYHEQALTTQERVLGVGHPDTAWSLSGLGMVLQEQGDHAGARSAFERALAICEQRFGPSHPETEILRTQVATLTKGLSRTR